MRVYLAQKTAFFQQDNESQVSIFDRLGKSSFLLACTEVLPYNPPWFL
jgi:hypothetical protein